MALGGSRERFGLGRWRLSVAVSRGLSDPVFSARGCRAWSGCSVQGRFMCAEQGNVNPLGLMVPVHDGRLFVITGHWPVAPDGRWFGV